MSIPELSEATQRWNRNIGWTFLWTIVLPVPTLFVALLLAGPLQPIFVLIKASAALGGRLIRALRDRAGADGSSPR